MNRKMVSDYFGGRRRVYWGQEGGFYPPYSISGRVRQDYSPVRGLALAIPLGFLGFMVIKGLTRKK